MIFGRFKNVCPRLSLAVCRYGSRSIELRIGSRGYYLIW